MREQDDPQLGLRIAGRTVGENLDQAIEKGDVVRDDGGRLSLSARANASLRKTETERGGAFIYRHGPVRMPCKFLNGFVFKQAYGEAAVPSGCRDCFKLRVDTLTLRAMMAAKEIAESTPHSTKSGSEVDDPGNDRTYVTYVYLGGLAQAQDTYRQVRAKVDADPRLGPGVAMTIKRGCSNYERKCGPSDRYTFDPALEPLEAHLAERYKKVTAPKTAPKAINDALRMLRLVNIAYRIGDPTYKDFTGGRPLYQPVLSWSPEPDAAEVSAPDVP